MMVKTIATLVLLAGCLDGHGSGGGGFPVDRPLPSCPTMIMTGQQCTAEPDCQWSEGIDAGASAIHKCRCDFGKWRCVTEQPDDLPDDPPPPPPQPPADAPS